MPHTPKQDQFVREYLIDLNGTQAAIRAGYSKRTANEQAARLLAKVSVREAIDRAQQERAERLDLDADWVVRSFRNLYLEALAEGDFSAAARCLENLGKHVGLFEKHQKQKQYTPAEVEQLRAELVAVGFDFSRHNFPSRN
jgi:phage terminase small subunit